MQFMLVEPGQSMAHSAPIYVVDERQRFVEFDAFAELVAASKSDLLELKKSIPNVDEELKPWEAGHRPRAMWAQQSPAIRASISRAHAVYDALLGHSRTGNQIDQASSAHAWQPAISRTES